jgi:hypothetical protein
MNGAVLNPGAHPAQRKPCAARPATAAEKPVILSLGIGFRQGLDRAGAARLAPAPRRRGRSAKHPGFRRERDNVSTK